MIDIRPLLACEVLLPTQHHDGLQIWQQHGTAEEPLRGIAGLEVPLHATGYEVDCDLWDVFNSRRAGTLHVHVQPTAVLPGARCPVLSASQ